MPDKLTFDQLFCPLKDLAFLDPSWIPILEKHLGSRIIDLVWNFPKKSINWHYHHTNYYSLVGQEIAIKVYINNYVHSRNRKSYFEVQGITDTGETIHIIYFKLHWAAVKKIYPLHSSKLIFGKLELQNQRFCMSHPKKIINIDAILGWSKVQVTYKALPKIPSVKFTAFMHEFISLLPEIAEWYPNSFIKLQSLPSWYDSVCRLHCLEKCMEVNLAYAERRLMLDELIAYQMALLYLRSKNLVINPDQFQLLTGKWVELCKKSLPFALTAEQIKVLNDIKIDLQASVPMVRLLQGDVGTGKTILALLTMLYMLERNQQSVISVPSALLAYQHYQTFQNFLSPLNIPCVCLTSKTKVSERKKIMKSIASGEVGVIIGTHSVLNIALDYKNLGLVIIDEQHKFGVNQRNKLFASQVYTPHLLMLTATPIPRTLALAQFGDISVSNLKDKLPNRKEIQTALFPLKQLDKLIERLDKQLALGEKVYWICAAINQGKSGNAIERYEFLSKIFGTGNVQLIHSKLNKSAQDQIIQKFSQESGQILVSTIILELGIDIPTANIMVIEEAESFGLSQLHQLRGRVGRNDQQGYCVLLCKDNLSLSAYQRLKIISDCNDGFVIAEQDLAIRGSGDIIWTRQSGLPEFKFLDPNLMPKLLPIALDYVKVYSNTNSENLMRLFDYQPTKRQILY